MSRPVTIVTGGSRGIGAATVLALARAGHDVAFSYRSNAAAAERVCAAATSDGARCLLVQADVRNDQDVERMFSQAARLGPVTGLVNNAGLTAHIGDLADTPVEVIREVIDVNLVGAVLCARHAAQVMSVRRGGPPARSSTSHRPLPRSVRPTSTCTMRRPRPGSTR
jgi:NAD(P)-dependent dehydrogenase (short-subunit alcohol dehydrogenase family)